jgi:type I restriction enzyme, R subunit
MGRPGAHGRHPDLVAYLNGLAVAVTELKRSSVEVADGVRQLITNQKEIFRKGFFSGVQPVLASSDLQSLHSRTVGTPEPFFMRWEGLADEVGRPIGETALAEGALLNPARLLDLMRHSGSSARA